MSDNLDPATTPVLGSFGSTGGDLTSSWYQMPESTPGAPLMTLSAAGRVTAVNGEGVVQPGQELIAEFGRPGP